MAGQSVSGKLPFVEPIEWPIEWPVELLVDLASRTTDQFTAHILKQSTSIVRYTIMFNPLSGCSTIRGHTTGRAARSGRRLPVYRYLLVNASDALVGTAAQ